MNPITFGTLACPSWRIQTVIAKASESGYDDIEWRGGQQGPVQPDMPAAKKSFLIREIIGRRPTEVCMTVGRNFAPEWHEYQDPLTGRRLRQLTDSPAEDYHLYFYNPSVTPDGRQVIFTSNRTGSSNVYLTDWE